MSAKLTRAELDATEAWIRDPFNNKMPPAIGTGITMRLIAHVRAQDEALRKIEGEAIKGCEACETAFRIARAAILEE